jgi:hypothetical protein
MFEAVHMYCAQCSKLKQSETEQLEMEGKAEKIKSLVNSITSYLAEF